MAVVLCFLDVSAVRGFSFCPVGDESVGIGGHLSATQEAAHQIEPRPSQARMTILTHHHSAIPHGMTAKVLLHIFLCLRLFWTQIAACGKNMISEVAAHASTTGVGQIMLQPIHAVRPMMKRSAT